MNAAIKSVLPPSFTGLGSAGLDWDGLWVELGWLVGRVVVFLRRGFVGWRSGLWDSSRSKH